MSADIDKIYKLLAQTAKQIDKIENNYTKELADIKKILKNTQKKITDIATKIQEFEVILDAAELLEEQIEKQEEYNTEWSPYEDEDYEAEEYEQYDDDEDEF